MKSFLKIAKLRGIAMVAVIAFALSISLSSVQIVKAASTNGSKYVTSIEENYITSLNMLALKVKANDKVGSVYATINNSSTLNYEISYKSSNLFQRSIFGVKANDKITIITYDLNNVKLESLTYTLNSSGKLVSSSTNTDTSKLTLTTTLKVKASVTFSALTGKTVNKTAVWSSSAPSIASVDKNGVVKALKEGTTIISAKSKDGKSIDSIVINVSNSGKAASSNKGDVTTKGINLLLTLKAKSSISFSALNSKGVNKTVTWSSSVPSVATVDKNGVVKALKAGTTVITVKSKDGKSSDSITIVVR